MHKIIPVAGPWITEKEISYVTDAATHAWYDQANKFVLRFEHAFKSYLGRKFAIALPSCTSALHLSLMALGVGPGDEVIVPDVTWIASAAPISYVGATPIFADIDPNTWCISAEMVRPLINSKTKAIVAVNLYGHMPEFDELLSLGVPIIEDAAESVGSKYKGRLSGTFGVTSCFSFHGSKTLTTGEGGMLLTDDPHIYERCLIMRDHGRFPGDALFQNIEIGYKYKMTDLQAALGLAQLERIDELVGRKRAIFDMYYDVFRHIDFLSLNPAHADVENSYWMATAIFDPGIQINKFEIIKRLQNLGISTRPFFDPLSNLKAYCHAKDAKRAQQMNRQGYLISSRGINLPSHAFITQLDITRIYDAVMKICNFESKAYAHY